MGACIHELIQLQLLLSRTICNTKIHLFPQLKLVLIQVFFVNKHIREDRLAKLLYAFPSIAEVILFITCTSFICASPVTISMFTQNW